LVSTALVGMGFGSLSLGSAQSPRAGARGDPSGQSGQSGMFNSILVEFFEGFLVLTSF
jgi:hypothetical protein